MGATCPKMWQMCFQHTPLYMIAQKQNESNPYLGFFPQITGAFQAIGIIHFLLAKNNIVMILY